MVATQPRGRGASIRRRRLIIEQLEERTLLAATLSVQDLTSTATDVDDRGSIQQEIWTGVAGNQVSDLTSNASYPSQPSGREYLLQFETIQQDWADNYGERLRGYIVPAISGDYVLAIAGDEQAELYLSTDASPDNKQLLASVSSATAFRDFTASSGQQSSPISLVAGQQYYVEALHKESTGTDHLSVGWQVPGTSQIAIIPGDVLVPYGTDTAVPAQGSFLATLAQGRPRLLSTPERFEWLKQQVAVTGQMQTWYNSIKSSANTILTLDLPEYTQDDRGTILSVSSTMVDHIYKLALVWRIGGDSTYAERAWQELEAAANFPDWHPAHFLDTAEMTHAFAIGYDWLYDYWTADRRATISSNIVSKGLNQALPLYRANSSWVASSSNNWNLVCNGGMVLGSLAIAEEQPDLVEEILAKAIPSVQAVMRHFTADAGAWYEGPGYWDYSTRYNTRMLAALESALGSDFGLGQTPDLSETGLFALYNTGPSKLSFNFADASAGMMRGAQLFWYARRYNLPVLAWHERTYASASPLDLLWYDTRGSDPASSDMPTDLFYHGDTSAYAAQDVVTLRGSWSDPNTTFVGFKAGKMGEAHGCLDAGSFVLDALGQRWAYDLGGDDYSLTGYFGSQRWTYYRLRAEGHNTLVINPTSGADQNVGYTASVLRQETSADASLSVADLTPVYNGVSRAWRGVRLSRSDGSLLVQDEIEATAAADVWWFMHVKLDASQVAIAADGTSAVLTQGSNRLWIKILPGSGGQLTLMDPTPLPTSPNPTGQNANAGYKKLAIHLENVTSRRLAVLMVPLSAGEDPPTRLPAVTPLADWSTDADAQNWLGDVDGYHAGDSADAAYVDAAWSTAIAAATAMPLAAFDTVADAQTVPFTFQFTVPAGQQVTAARLTVGLRSTSGDSTSDRLYLDDAATSFTYAGLGWTALSTTPTARTLDLAYQLRLLQDGQLDLATSGNTAVDWAHLDLEFGPTGLYQFNALAPEADASVRDGTYADQNFAASDLATKNDTTGENRESYLRFDLSGVTEQVTSAMVCLVPTAAGARAENQLAFVADDAWTESGLTWNTRPTASAASATWTTTAGLPLLLDVTALVQQELDGDKHLSLRLSSTTALAEALTNYGSRENPDVTLRPQLIVTTLAADARTSLTITGDAAGSATNDTIRLVGAQGYLDVFVNNTSSVPDFRRDLCTLQELLVTAGAGDDTLSLDYAVVALLPSGSLNLDGGADSDLLSLSGPITVTASPGQLLADGHAIPTANFETQAFPVAALVVSGTTVRFGLDNAVSPSTDLTISDNGTLDLNGHTTSADAVTLVDGSIIGGTLSAKSYILQNGTASAILGGTAGLTKNTTGKVTLTAANTYTGTTLIYQGTLSMQNGQAFGLATSAVTVSCDGATSRYSTLEFDGPDFTVASRPLNTTGVGFGSVGALHNVSGNHTWIGSVTLTGGGGGSTYQSDSGTLTLVGDLTTNMASRSLVLQGIGNGAILGAIQDGLTVGLPITKQGTGSWTLTGTNTYTGKTTVKAGTLLVNSPAVAGAVIVSSGATLAGNAGFGASSSCSGILMPGGNGSVGTLTFGGLQLWSMAMLNLDLGLPGSSDLIRVDGTLAANAVKPYVTNLGTMQPGTYTLLDYQVAGTSIGGLTLGTMPAGFGYQLVHDTANTSINLLVTNSSPTISAIANQTINQDTSTAAIAFTVGDTETPAAQLLVSAASSDPLLLPAASILLGGSGANRTITLAPAAQQFGTCTVTVSVTDAGGAASSQSFTLTVNQVLYSLDADGNGQADALSDGILILRYLFDPSGEWNYSDALGSGATRTTRTDIRSFLDGARNSVLDVDGNGEPDALTDGILILRYLFDPSGEWNYSDALGSGATRTTRPDIKAFLDLCQPSLAAATDAPLPETATLLETTPLDTPESFPAAATADVLDVVCQEIAVVAPADSPVAAPSPVFATQSPPIAQALLPYYDHAMPAPTLRSVDTHVASETVAHAWRAWAAHLARLRPPSAADSLWTDNTRDWWLPFPSRPTT